MKQSPLVIDSDSVMRVQRCLVAWSLKNVRSSNTLVKTKSGVDSTVTIPQGYYNFSGLQSVLEDQDITIEKLADNRVSILCSDALDLKTFGLLLGFEENQNIVANTKTTSRNPASLTNGLKDIVVYSDLVDSMRVYSYVVGECLNSSKFFELSTDTTQSLNGDFTEYNLNALEIPCRSFQSQEFEIYVTSGGDYDDYEIYLTMSVS